MNKNISNKSEIILFLTLLCWKDTQLLEIKIVFCLLKDQVLSYRQVVVTLIFSVVNKELCLYICIYIYLAYWKCSWSCALYRMCTMVPCGTRSSWPSGPRAYNYRRLVYWSCSWEGGGCTGSRMECHLFHCGLFSCSESRRDLDCTRPWTFLVEC